MGNIHKWGLGALLAGATFLNVAKAEPYTPKNDTQVIGTLPLRAGDSSARALAELRSAVAQAPTDPAPAALPWPRPYFDLAMARGDPRYVGYADAIVQRFSAKPPASLQVVRGTLRQYRHDFAGALADYASALAADPDLADAHAWRAAIFLVQARYDLAQQECTALQRLGRPVLHGGCAGLVQAYTGRLDQAYATLQQALAAARYDEHRLWLHTRLGEVSAWQGRPAQAEQHYRRALGLGQDDGYLLAAWSDFLLDQNRAAEVVKQLASWEASDGLLLRLAEAEARLKLPQAALPISRHWTRVTPPPGCAAIPRTGRKRRVTTCGCAEMPSSRPFWPPRTTKFKKNPATPALPWKPRWRPKTLSRPAMVLAWLRSSQFQDPLLQSLGQQLAQLRANAAPGSKP
jgi:tetratricopeptide (TPR) repeat protein